MSSRKQNDLNEKKTPKGETFYVHKDSMFGVLTIKDIVDVFI